jgi:hypothetical protein
MDIHVHQRRSFHQLDVGNNGVVISSAAPLSRNIHNFMMYVIMGGGGDWLE